MKTRIGGAWKNILYGTNSHLRRNLNGAGTELGEEINDQLSIHRAVEDNLISKQQTP